MGEQHPRHHRYDVVVIGSGAAGLALALRLPRHQRIAVLAKGDVTQSSTYWAQGGMAAVLHARDSVEAHVEDTLAVGAGLCHRDAVEFTVSRSRETVDWLVELGVDFDLRQDIDASQSPEYHLAQEGGIRTGASSTPRTERAARSAMCCRRAPAQPAISTCCRDASPSTSCAATAAAAVSMCWIRSAIRWTCFEAPAVALASGGASKAYLYTSNPDGASGDGIAMAWRAGCRVANMEFNQFHPTCLYHPQAKSFLITEALRGEGAAAAAERRAVHAALRRARGAGPARRRRRAIDHEMKRLGQDCVLLDISHRDPDFIRAALPDHPRALPGPRHRHDDPAHPRGSGGPLHLRRRGRRRHGSTDLPGLYASASAPTPACTAPTAWPATPCWNAWSTHRRQRHTSPPPTLPEPDAPRICRPGMRAR
jgi:L-aspartate oxidase